jgi:hypothetical protein
MANAQTFSIIAIIWGFDLATHLKLLLDLIAFLTYLLTMGVFSVVATALSHTIKKLVALIRCR